MNVSACHLCFKKSVVFSVRWKVPKSAPQYDRRHTAVSVAVILRYECVHTAPRKRATFGTFIITLRHAGRDSSARQQRDCSMLRTNVHSSRARYISILNFACIFIPRRGAECAENNYTPWCVFLRKDAHATVREAAEEFPVVSLRSRTVVCVSA